MSSWFTSSEWYTNVLPLMQEYIALLSSAQSKEQAGQSLTPQEQQDLDQKKQQLDVIVEQTISHFNSTN
jgi:hypothetical protein